MNKTQSPGVLIVGAGAAGATAASELRALGYEGPLTVVNGEHEAPYNRTTVNKSLLQGQVTVRSVALPTPADAATTWLNGVRALEVDSVGRRARLDTGEWLSYEALLIATGASPRRLDVHLAPKVAARVRVLRTAADAHGLRSQLDQAATRRDGEPVRVGIIGAGLLGAETAESLVEAGADVTLVDPETVPLGRLLGDAVGGWVRQRHEEHLRTAFGLTMTDLDSLGDELMLRLSDGSAIRVDLVLAAVGVQPSVAWLRSSDLFLDDGVVSDDRLRAKGVAGVYVAGDLARPDGGAGPRRRFEHWGHALAQGRHVARVIGYDLGIAEDPGPFDSPLSFATRLYGKGMTILGSRDPEHREVVLAGDVTAGAVTVGFVDTNDRLKGVVALGSPKVANMLRPLVATTAALAEVVAILAPIPAPAGA